MSLPEIALKYPASISVVLLMLIVLGGQSYFTMPRSEDPQFEFPSALVRIVKPGTAVEDMESLIVEPIEEAIYELDDVKHIKTNIQTGVVSFNVEFVYGSDPDDKFDEVVAAVERTRSKLPEPLQLVAVDQVSPKDVSIAQLALVSVEASLYDLRLLAEQLEHSLERISGVKRALVQGAPMQEVRVDVDPVNLHSLGLTGLELVSVISQGASNVPIGYKQLDGQRINIKGSGDYDSLTALEEAFLLPNNPVSPQVRQAAHVSIQDPDPSYRAFMDGQPAIWVSVEQREGTRIEEVLGEVDELVAQWQAQLPNHIDLKIIHDQRVSTHRRVAGFFFNLMQGLILVLLASAIFLGWQSAIVVAGLVPISIGMALGWLDLMGYGLQQMSIVGLVIALGLLVDNALVVTESVGHRRSQGLPPHRAAIMGANTVAWPIVAGTATTILAFVPLLALPNNSGTFMRSMPIMVVLTLVASLIGALTLAPLAATYLYSRKTPKSYQALEQFTHLYYRPFLESALKHPKKILLLAFVLWGLSLGLFPVLGFSLFPKAEKHMVNVYLEKSPGTTFDQMKVDAQYWAEQFQQEAGVTHVAVNVGRENPRVYYNLFPSRQVPHLAHLLVFFDRTLPISDVQTEISRWRERYRDQPGLKLRIREFQQGPPTAAPLAIRLISTEIDALRESADRVEKVMMQHPAVLNLENPLREVSVDLRIGILREKAAQLGVPLDRIDQTLSLLTQGVSAGFYQDLNGDDLPILIRLGAGYSLSEVLGLTYVRGHNQEKYPLSALVEMRLEGSLTRLQHYNVNRMARLTADVQDGYNVRAVTQDILSDIEGLDLPTEVRVEVGGDEASRKESFAGMSQAITFALLGVLSILVLQFRSLTQPVIILTATPFAVTGALIGLWLIGSSFSFTAFIGLTALIGIVVNNAILLVDAANRKINQGFNANEAILRAGQQRFIPILLTTLTTVLGLLPLSVAGSGLWMPMGTVIIGGLIVSTLLTLIIVPVLYVSVGGYQAHKRQESALNLPEEV